jgi:hypothetical protein
MESPATLKRSTSFVCVPPAPLPYRHPPKMYMNPAVSMAACTSQPWVGHWFRVTAWYQPLLDSVSSGPAPAEPDRTSDSNVTAIRPLMAFLLI